MIDKVDTSQIQDIFGKSSLKQPDSTVVHQDNRQDASLQVNYESLMKEATAISQKDHRAVQRARKLLSDGELETFENIRQAAENIVNFGI